MKHDLCGPPVRKTSLTPLEARQLLAGIQQDNEELMAALTNRLTSLNITCGKHSDDRIIAAIRVHRAAIARVWEPSLDSGISAASRKQPPAQAEAEI